MLANLRRRWLLLVLLILVALAAYAYATGVSLPLVGGRGMGAGAPAEGGSAPAAPAGYVAGRPLAFGDGEYTVTDARRGAEVPGRLPRGAFLQVAVRARNAGHEPLMLKPADFALVDGAGRHFSPDEEATKAVAGDRKDDLFAGPLQPGLTAEGTLVFDIPGDARDLALRIGHGYVDVRLAP